MPSFYVTQGTLPADAGMRNHQRCQAFDQQQESKGMQEINRVIQRIDEDD